MADVPEVQEVGDLRSAERDAQLAGHCRDVGGSGFQGRHRPGSPSTSVAVIIQHLRLPSMIQSSAIDFGDRLQTSFAQVFGELLPALGGAVIILFAGYLLAKVLEKLTERFLRRIRFNRLLERGGVLQAVERSGSHFNPIRVLSNLVFWLVMFAVILVAANALGLESLANVFGELVSYIPSVIAAIIIILAGIVLGGFVGGLIAASAGALHGGRALARVGRGGVILLAVFMALQELGIATDIVTTAFAILFGAIALAMALAFGLGNRELAGEVTREWYEQYRLERDAALARERELEAREDAEMEIEFGDRKPSGMQGSE